MRIVARVRMAVETWKGKWPFQRGPSISFRKYTSRGWLLFLLLLLFALS